MLSLREAAELAGTSKSSILRAVKTGRLSATRNQEGEFKVDPAEVARVYDKGHASHRGRRVPMDRGEAGEHSDDANRIGALAAENAALKDLIRRLDQDKEDLKRDRDIWRTQFERLALAPPTPPRRSWWRWRSAGG